MIKTIGYVNTKREQHKRITKYIFTGGYTQSLSDITKTKEKTGNIIKDIED